MEYGGLSALLRNRSAKSHRLPHSCRNNRVEPQVHLLDASSLTSSCLRGVLTRLSRCFPYITVFVVACVCYLNSLSGQFVHDDLFAVVNNMDIRPQTPLVQLLYNDYWGKAMSDNQSHKSYRPLTVFTFRMNFLLGGLDPYWFHVVNILLHATASALFTHVAKHGFKLKDRLAMMCGLMFAVHPIHTEAVSGIVGRADVLCCILFLLSFIAYTKVDDANRRSWLWLAVSVVLSFSAMLAKEQGITVLAILVLYEIVKRRHLSYMKKAALLTTVRRIAVLIGAATCMLLFRLGVMKGQLPEFTDQDNPAAYCNNSLTSMMTRSYIHSLNFYLLTCPLTLSYDWSMNAVSLVTSLCDLSHLYTFVVFLVLACVTGKAIYASYMEGSNNLILALGFLIAPYLPASNIFFNVGFVVAERILYIPSMGFIMLVVLGLDKLYDKYQQGFTHTMVQVLHVLLLVALTSRTLIRNHVWYDRDALFRSGIQNLPHNAKMHYNMGNLLKDDGNTEEAMHHYRQAIRLWPSYASAYNNLGTLMASRDEAADMYRQALQVSPCHASALINLGIMYSRMAGKEEEAVTHLEAALVCDPRNPQPHVILAQLYYRLGDEDASERCLQIATSLAYEKPDVSAWIAFTLHEQGSSLDAWSVVQSCLVVDISHVGCLRLARVILPPLNLTQNGTAIFSRALQVSTTAELLYEAGLFYKTMNDTVTASRYLTEALSKHRSGADLRIKLAIAVHEAGLSHLASAALQELTNKDPRNIRAVLVLSNIYGALHEHKEAISMLTAFLDTRTLVDDHATAADVHFHLGNHYKDHHNLEKAFQHFLLSESLNSNNSDVHHNMAVYYHRQGNTEAARKHYTAAQRLAPDDALIRQNALKMERMFRQQSHDTASLNDPTTTQRQLQCSSSLYSVNTSRGPSNNRPLQLDTYRPVVDPYQGNISSYSANITSMSMYEQRHISQAAILDLN